MKIDESEKYDLRIACHCRPANVLSTLKALEELLSGNKEDTHDSDYLGACSNGNNQKGADLAIRTEPKRVMMMLSVVAV